MLGGRMGAVGTIAALLALASAGPLHRLPRESEDYQSLDPYDNYTANEMCFSDNKVFQKGALMPNPGPCEECRCEPPSIVCNMIKCPVNNNGCRTIQRANHCCPDYNCECDYNGQLYNDGERLDLPEEPCQVCYCKGGEVMCTSITCYQRSDCTPIHVPGQCCPKYENCPLRDEAYNGEDKDGRTKQSNKTGSSSPKREMQPWLLTKSIPQASSLPLPKQPDGTTTEDGNIVIVSDWLTERKTTTEDAPGQDVSRQEITTSDHTDGPVVVTDLGHSMTVQQQKKDNQHLEGSDSVIKSETITPVDEVIFTRIDMLKEAKDDSIDSSTSTPLNMLDGEGNKPKRPEEENEEFISIAKTTEVDFITTTAVYPKQDEDKSLQMKKVYADKEPNRPRTETQSTSERTTSNIQIGLQETVSIDNHDLNGNGEIKIGDIETTSDTTISDVTVNVLAENKPSNTVNANVLEKQYADASRNENSDQKAKESDKSEPNNFQSSQEITLEGLFGLNTSSVDDAHYSSLIETSTYFTSGEPENILKEQLEPDLSTQHEDSPLTNIPNTTDGYFNENLLEDASKLSLTNEEVEQVSSDRTNGSVVQGPNSSVDFTVTTTLEDVGTTTPFSTEDHMTGFNLEADKLLQEFRNIEEETTVSEVEYTKEPEETTVKALVETETSNDLSQSGERDSLLFDMKNADILLEDSTATDSTESTINNESTEATTIDTMNESGIQETELFTADFNEDGTKYDVHEIIPFKNGENNTFSPINATVSDLEEGSSNALPRIETVKISSLNLENESEILNNNISANTLEEREVTLNVHNEDLSDESEEGISSAPPVLELNSHVPFLQIGGHYTSDTSSEESDEPNSTAMSMEEKKVLEANKAERIEMYDGSSISSDASIRNKENIVTFDISVTTPPLSTDEINTDKVSTEKIVESRTDTEEVTTILPTLISLTPGDLKVLAEYLIHEKIKPVPTDDSKYLPNQWLTGNLTSEEKMASILSAANISIGIMNQTEPELKMTALETSTRSNEPMKVEKFDKEILFKGNSIVDHTKQFLNKTGFLHNKYSKNHDVAKNAFNSQTVLNDVTNIYRAISTDSLNEIFPSTARMNPEVQTEKVTENTSPQNSQKLNATLNLNEMKPNEKYSDEFLSKNYKENKHLFNSSTDISQGETVTTTTVNVDPTASVLNDGNRESVEKYRNEERSVVTEDSSTITGGLSQDTKTSSSPKVNSDLTTPKQVSLEHILTP